MAKYRIPYKYLVLGCDRCRFADKTLLTEKALMEKKNPCGYKDKLEYGKHGKCLKRQKPLAW